MRLSVAPTVFQNNPDLLLAATNPLRKSKSRCYIMILYKALANMSTPEHWEEKYVDLSGVKMRYHRTGGNKPPLLLLHGFSDNGLCWTRIAKDLQDNYDVIMPNARGHGQSVPKNDVFSIRTLASDAAELIQKLNIKKPIVMGHSMGGQTATMLAANYPELISKIILEDPAYGLKRKGGKFYFLVIGLAFALMIQLKRKRSEEKIRKRCRKMNPKWHEDEVIPWARAAKEFAKKESLDLLKKMGSLEDWHEIFPLVTTPTLLLIPSHGMLKLKDAEKILLEFPENNAKIVFIKKSGHSVRRDNYPALLDAVQSFLKEE
ncbi:MAG: alpha/beta fold hydrolase [Promethearchaeota archaeon]